MKLDKNILAKNSAYIALMNIFEKAFGFLVTILVARLLSTTDYGIFTAAFAFSTLFISIFELGFPLIIPRFISQDKEKSASIITSGITLVGISYPIFLICILLYLNYAPWGVKDVPIIIAFLAVINQATLGVTKLFKGAYLGFERVGYDTLFTLLAKIVLSALIASMLFIEPSIKFVYIFYTLSNLIYLVFLILFLKKIDFKLRVSFDKELTYRILSNVAPLILISIFYNIYSNIDALIIFNKLGEVKTAFFGGAKRIYLTFAFIPAAINIAFYPSICKAVTEDKNHLIDTIRLNIKTLLTISLPLVVGLVIYSEELIYFTLGSKYSNSALILKFLSPTLLILAFSTMLGNLIYSQNKLKLFTMVTGSALVVNILLNLALIPIFSAKGGAIAHFGTELSIILVWFFIFKYELLKAFNKEHGIIFILNAIGAVLIFGLNNFIETPFRLFISFILFGTVYLFLLKVFKIFDGFNIVKNIIKPPKTE